MPQKHLIIVDYMVKNFMKKFLAIVLVALTACLLAVSQSSCKKYYYPEFESGYFRYAVKTLEDGSQKAYLIGLTESGAQQKALVYPGEIDGITVYGIGYKREPLEQWFNPMILWRTDVVSDFESDVLEKIYFATMPIEVINTTGVIPKLDNKIDVVYWNIESIQSYSFILGEGREIYGYNFIEKDWTTLLYNEIIANVSYMYNFDGSPNKGYYWVDSYNETTIDFIPPEPERAGYKFDGWYKEPECETEWNFETDITGKEFKYGSNLNSLEMKRLYAKWVTE